MKTEHLVSKHYASPTALEVVDHNGTTVGIVISSGGLQDRIRMLVRHEANGFTGTLLLDYVQASTLHEQLSQHLDNLAEAIVMEQAGNFDE